MEVGGTECRKEEEEWNPGRRKLLDRSARQGLGKVCEKSFIDLKSIWIIDLLENARNKERTGKYLRDQMSKAAIISSKHDYFQGH